ncbi:ABC transporter permease [Sphingobium algorifonticola]|uniref:FtsX-like permease family protein n=1 Tax=Sphingobium algorifonticola TaxID=2008318 RepID=A0A437J9F5_9SPHN|nr:FtsX-like permease family protein [Sphingobium algorifonticola]RVT42020.1 FtsX-like permease family protein [Sphingobium algorifonticola]
MMLALRFALRDLRGGLQGLRLLIVCLFLGVAALAGIGSLTASINAALSEQGQVILGGDIGFDLNQRSATPEERAAMAREGALSQTTRMRAMVARTDGSDAVLSELKAIDAAWPLYGAFTLDGAGSRPKRGEVALADTLADRLGVKAGGQVRIGDVLFRVSGIIAQEPDRVGAGFTFGPSAIIAADSLPATGLLQPGSIYETRYRIRMPAAADPQAAIDRINAAAPQAGWEARDRANGSPGTRRFIDRMGQFLSLVGLAALVVAGIGVGNGVASYLDGKRPGIATMKALGASTRTIFLTYLLQILIVSCAGFLLGLAVGAALPWIVTLLAGDLLPVPPSLGLYPVPLLTSAAYGLLTALLFAIVPLVRARNVAAAALFRGGLGDQGRTGRWVWLAVVVIAALIVALAIGTAREPMLAAIFLGAAFALFVMLALLGSLVQWIAARLPRPRHPLGRLALANLHRPGAQTGRLMVALGLGLSLFATLAVVETNLSGQMASSIPAKAPSFFALDIPSDGVDQFRTIVTRQAPGADIVTTPSLRGPVVAVRDQRVSDMKDIPEDAWILRGDRGLTYAEDLPRGNSIVDGAWWPKDYSGEPLVSVDIRAAKALNLKIGDMLTVSVLGVEIPARIASFREIDWDSMGLNFGMIFSPNALEGAPHSYLATIALPGGAGAAAEKAINRDVIRAFPSASLIRVKEVIASLGDLLTQLSAAVRVAASVAIAAGIAVLVGAIAAARRSRTYDAVLLKLLGATRRQVLIVQALEYAALALLVSGIALAVASGAGWYLATQTLGLQWAPDWGVVLATLAGGAALTLALGLVGSLPALAARPAQALRTL